MGRATLQGMIEQATFAQALAWHIQGNLYPPPPSYMVDVARQAIEACNAGDITLEIELPEGTLYRGRDFARPYEIVEAFHLEAFLDESDDEYASLSDTDWED